ncbi:MAG: restriction endonuclease subunit S [Crocosphaera sp.]
MSNSDWQNVQLGDVAQELTVGYVGSMTKEYVESGIPFLRSKNVEPFNIKWEDMRYIGRNFHKKIKKSSLSPGDVVIVRTGKPGSAAIIPEWLKEANCSDLVIVRPGNDLDARFLVYYLNSLASHHINSHLVGAVQQHFNVGSARTLRLKLPPLPEQKAIASILSSLDDKIELNQQMNQTLEAMARAIFKSWFVDFDPVRAKMAGKQPVGMDAATANLFPDSFEESALGLIPKGWEVIKLEKLIDIKHGYAFKGEFFSTEPQGDILLTPGNFAIGGGFKEDKFKYYVGEVPDEYILQEGDLLVTMTDLSKASDTLGYPAFIPPEKEYRYLHNQRLGKIIFKSHIPVTNLYLYYLLRTDAYRHEVLASATGTTVKHTSPNRIQAFEFPFPNNNLAFKFDSLVKPFYQKHSYNNLQSETLANIRDTLLPKLMSGEIRVKEAETIIEEVT